MNLNNNLELHRRATKKTSKKVQMLELRRKLYAGISLATVFLMYALDVGNVQSFVGGALASARELVAHNFDFPDETETLASTMTPTAELATETPAYTETPTPTRTPRPETPTPIATTTGENPETSPTESSEQEKLAKIIASTTKFYEDKNCVGDCGSFDVTVSTESVGGEPFFTYTFAPKGKHAEDNMKTGMDGTGMNILISDRTEKGRVSQKYQRGIFDPETNTTKFYSPLFPSTKSYDQNTAAFRLGDRPEFQIFWDPKVIKMVNSDAEEVIYDYLKENQGFIYPQNITGEWEKVKTATPIAKIETNPTATDAQRVVAATLELDKDPFDLKLGTRRKRP